jgi:hypothetical protein
MFKANVGEVDANIRLLIGAVVMGLAFFASGGVEYVLGIVGLMLIFTALLRFCPAYTLLGKNTCDAGKK